MLDLIPGDLLVEVAPVPEDLNDLINRVAGVQEVCRDAYFEAYEVDDEEFWKVLEEVSDDPDPDPDRDLAYYVRERGRLVCRIEPSYTIIVNDAR
jgi:hypothetical protein